MHLFHLHPRLEADTVLVADWALSRVLLMNDARFPWLVLVPRRANITEIFELAHAERLVLIEEIARVSKGLRAVANAAKMNVGALGNQVPQLHIHVVARHDGDAAWPGSVWGQGAAVPYEAAVADALKARLQAEL